MKKEELLKDLLSGKKTESTDIVKSKTYYTSQVNLKNLPKKKNVGFFKRLFETILNWFGYTISEGTDFKIEIQLPKLKKKPKYSNSQIAKMLLNKKGPFKDQNQLIVKEKELWKNIKDTEIYPSNGKESHFVAIDSKIDNGITTRTRYEVNPKLKKIKPKKDNIISEPTVNYGEMYNHLKNTK